MKIGMGFRRLGMGAGHKMGLGMVKGAKLSTP